MGNYLSVDAGGQPPLLNLTEDEFTSRVSHLKPEEEDGVFAKFLYSPPRLAADASDEEREAYQSQKFAYDTEYQSRCFPEFMKFAKGNPENDLYLALQPIWHVTAERYTLAQVEVLVRAKNGRDAAPMPALAMFQQHCKDDALMFLQSQMQWAADCARKLPGIMVSVNVRPDELPAASDFIHALHLDLQRDGCSNLVLEITEYSPITPEVLATIHQLKEAGVLFALDDVNSTARREKGYAAPDHACTFEVASEHAHLFYQQKLAIHLACQVFNVHVQTTPGEVDKYFASLLLKDDAAAMIAERRELVEKWVGDVQLKNPSTLFVIEASVHPEDVCEYDGSIHRRFPQIDLFSGSFLVQGGKTGGRCYSLDTFLRFS